ncbi:MAG: hypothetical protein OXU34_05560 [Gammaproteobacteria bacterium]|nr:hypothetical protein [Gammaproteobacteria bacterium]
MKLKVIILISCASRKLSCRAKARDLYISPLFKLSLRYAEGLKADGIFILSAKHGLLPLSREIEPYEQTLNDMRAAEIKIWAEKVLAQLKGACSVEQTAFIFLAGEKYRKYLLPHLTNTEIPLQGLRIGQQMKELKRLCHER